MNGLEAPNQLFELFTPLVSGLRERAVPYHTASRRLRDVDCLNFSPHMHHHTFTLLRAVADTLGVSRMHTHSASITA
eukprot:XP_001699453.1 predicted protein [Chlamydomonas reinhardtii]